MEERRNRLRTLALAVALIIGALLIGSLIAFASPSNSMTGKNAQAISGPSTLPQVIQGVNNQLAGEILVTEDTVTTSATGSIDGRDLWLRVSSPSSGVTFAAASTVATATTGDITIGATTVADNLVSPVVA